MPCWSGATGSAASAALPRGAIAAAVTVTAEFNRRHTGTRAGFDTLSRLPQELQENIPGTSQSKLLSLFQAQPGTKRLFSTLVASLNSAGNGQRIGAILAATCAPTEQKGQAARL